MDKTLREIDLKVAVLGEPGVGKTTFIKSLQPWNDDKAGHVQVRDVKNNIQINYQFQEASFDNVVECAVSTSVCTVLIYDIADGASFDRLK